MKLRQAINAFSNTTVDGWDQTTGMWHINIAKGAILTFDRFITERAFGQKKRIFQVAGGSSLPPNIEAIRDKAGTRYLVSYYNNDIAFDEVYNHVYLIQRADHDAELISYVSQIAASGTPVGKTLQVDTTFPVDFEKISTGRSSEFDNISYSGFIATCPASVNITTDHELRIDGILYDIEEVYESIGLKALKMNKRSGTT